METFSKSQLALIQRDLEEHKAAEEIQVTETLRKLLNDNKTTTIKITQKVARACQKTILECDRTIAFTQAKKFEYLLEIEGTEDTEGEDRDFKRACWEDHIELANLYIQRQSLCKKEALIRQKRLKAIESHLSELQKERDERQQPGLRQVQVEIPGGVGNINTKPEE